jgi:hypothetical protein
VQILRENSPFYGNMADLLKKPEWDKIPNQ